jgi:nucleoid-associated protein EbfC
MFNLKDVFSNFAGMQSQMETLRKRVAALHITGEAGAGLVKVTVNGEGTMLKVDIDNSLLKEDSKSMLIELIISASNTAQEKSRDAMQHEMKSIMGGIPIPGLDKLLGK